MTATVSTGVEGVPEEWWENLDPLPGWTIEIIQGELVVTPSPTPDHAFAQEDLGAIFRPNLPYGFVVVQGLEWRLAVGGVVAAAPQPDLMIVPRTKGLKAVTVAPLLAVEVISPSDSARILNGMTRLEGKRRDYQANGLEHYLEVDLLGKVPSVTRYEGPDLLQVEQVEGDEALEVTVPFSYRIMPAKL